MRNYLNNSVVEVRKEYYLMLLIILAPLLNFLSGITFDLHAPSLPAIATYYGTPFSAAKSTISISLLGFSIGCLLFGVLLDIFGRRPVILLGLLTYTIASFLAVVCSSINELLFIRFIQGFAVSSISIGCRTIILDNFTGHQFKVAILYTSLAFGLGPIIAPFVGGYLQYHFGWKANFIAYGIISLSLMLIFFVYIAESQKITKAFTWPGIIEDHLSVIWHKAFLPAIIIIGLCQIQLLVYTTTGALLIENILHQSAIVYGNSALIISSGYLIGTLINRFLIKHFQIHNLISLGFLFLIVGVLLQFYFAVFSQMKLITIIIPIVIIGFSNGFIFINIFSSCLRLSNKAGIATSLFTSSAMVIATLGIYIISHINVNNLMHLAIIFGTTAFIQAVVYFLKFQKIVMEF